MNKLKCAWIETILGPMMAIADEKALYLLEFGDRKNLEREIEKMKQNFVIVEGRTDPIHSIEIELKMYFAGSLKDFKTPLFIGGTPFQKLVWNELQKIPNGETRSYSEIAKALNKPTAFRAVAMANSSNQLAILVPCHRVINANGDIGGYAGGINKKEWLLFHEKLYCKK